MGFGSYKRQLCAVGGKKQGRLRQPGCLLKDLGAGPDGARTGQGDDPAGAVRRAGITKAANRRVRHLLVESAWTYRHPPKIRKEKLYLPGGQPRLRKAI